MNAGLKPALQFLMEFRFETIEYDRTLPNLPKHSGVYKIDRKSVV